MRQIVLDTETTGLEPALGHRVIEIGCVEIVNRRITEHRYQQYLNPQREIDDGAVEVHGITLDDLREKPQFGEVIADFIEFIRGAELVIHNADFDVGFLDAELALVGSAWGNIKDYCTVFDTLQLAREVHPGQRNSLDALCRRYEVDNTHRGLHGALLDAELLAEVYLAMTGGQASLALETAAAHDSPQRQRHGEGGGRAALAVIAPTQAELAAHHATLRAIDQSSGGNCVWSRPGPQMS